MKYELSDSFLSIVLGSHRWEENGPHWRLNFILSFPLSRNVIDRVRRSIANRISRTYSLPKKGPGSLQKKKIAVMAEMGNISKWLRSSSYIQSKFVFSFSFNFKQMASNTSAFVVLGAQHKEVELNSSFWLLNQTLSLSLSLVLRESDDEGDSEPQRALESSPLHSLHPSALIRLIQPSLPFYIETIS